MRRLGWGPQGYPARSSGFGNVPSGRPNKPKKTSEKGPIISASPIERADEGVHIGYRKEN